MPGHFYSTRTSPADVERALRQPPVTDRVDIREAAQDELIARLGPLLAEFEEGPRWHRRPENDQFGLADGAIYTAMLRAYKPNRVIEVGSGYSSAAEHIG